MDIVQLTEAGKQLGYQGEELRAFVKEERERIEKQEIKRKEEEKERIEREEKKEKARIKLEEKKEIERFQLEAKKENQRLERELKVRAQEDEIKENEHRRMLQMKEKEIEMMKINKEKTSGKIEVAANRPKLPKFDEENDDMDSFLERFEIFATIQKWRKDEWSISLSPLLTGKGLQVFTSMPPADINDYTKLKRALLKRYQLTEEGFRRKFRDAYPEDNESVYQFIARIRRYFQRWVEMTEIDKTYDSLQELLIKEQYINTCSAEMKIYLRERRIKDIDELTGLAERYTEARSNL